MARRPGLTTPSCRRTPAAVTVGSRRCDEPAQVRLAITGVDRELLACSRAGSTRRAGGHPRRRLRGWLPRRTRGHALAMLAVSLVVLFGGTLAVTAATSAAATAAQPAPAPPLPTVDTCAPGSPLPVCPLPAPTTPAPLPAPGAPVPIPTGPPPSTTCLPEGCLAPLTTAGVCAGPGCPAPLPGSPFPAGTANTSPGDSGGGDGGGGGGGDADCGLLPSTWAGCFTNMITAFFRGIVADALNPLLQLLSHSLLTTPPPDHLPRIGELWTTSWQILLACYALLVVAAGVLIMAYETLQTRHAIKDIAPRIIVGFLGGALSLWIATQAIDLANALAQAVMGDGVDATTAGDSLRRFVVGSPGQGVWLVLLALVLIGLLVVLLITYLVRVACTIILIAGAPLALMFHALPHTEGIARWWWKAFGGCLAIQLCQSLTLITAIKVFLAPGGFAVFGPTPRGLVNLLLAIALVYILIRIPFWILRSVRGGPGHRTMLGSLLRGVLTYTTFGILRGRTGAARAPHPARRQALGGRGGGSRAGGGAGRSIPMLASAAPAVGSTFCRPRGRGVPAHRPRPHPPRRRRRVGAGGVANWRCPSGMTGRRTSPSSAATASTAYPSTSSASHPHHRRPRHPRLSRDPTDGVAPDDSWSCRSTPTTATGRPARASTRSHWTACAVSPPPHPRPRPHHRRL